MRAVRGLCQAALSLSCRGVEDLILCPWQLQGPVKPPPMSQPEPPAEAKPPLPREGTPAGASPAEAAAAAAKLQQEVPLHS
jgi:hypothetical protein